MLLNSTIITDVIKKRRLVGILVKPKLINKSSDRTKSEWKRPLKKPKTRLEGLIEHDVETLGVIGKWKERAPKR